MVYSINNFKMAESTWSRESFASGRARALIDAIAYFENQRNRGRGRAGMVPLNQTRALSRNTSEYSRWEEGYFPCGRAGALSTVEHQLGGLSARRGRGRGLSPPTPPTPPPLEDHSPPVRCHEAPPRQPHTMPFCLWPHGCFPSPPPYTLCDPNAPCIMMNF